MGNCQFKYKKLQEEKEDVKEDFKDKMKQKVKFILYFMFSKLKLFFIIG